VRTVDRAVLAVHPAMRTCYIGLGANLGSPRLTIEQAIGTLRTLDSLRLSGCSRLYRSAPIGATGPDFVNAVIRVQSAISAIDLLRALQQVERDAGRQRPYPNAPRTLDLDLLLVDQETIDHPDLQVPHPRMHLRAFVLAPLLELDPAIVIPGHGPARLLWANCLDQELEPIGSIAVCAGLDETSGTLTGPLGWEPK
jgi:2-amino-4-hydroxy-6-hydroxymethyldihydropteridine diphosphokinase